MSPAQQRASKGGEISPDDRRQEILRTAAQLFANEGVVPTTVRDIASAVGILSGSLYHHFDSKESMVDEILSPCVHRLVESDLRVVRESSSTRDALEGLIRTVVSAVAEEPDAWRILQNDSAYLQTLDRFSYLTKFDGQVTKLWTDVLKKGVKEGIVRNDIPVDLLYRYIRDSVAMIARWYRPEGNYSLSKIADSWVSLNFSALTPER